MQWIHLPSICHGTDGCRRSGKGEPSGRSSTEPVLAISPSNANDTSPRRSVSTHRPDSSRLSGRQQEPPSTQLEIVVRRNSAIIDGRLGSIHPGDVQIPPSVHTTDSRRLFRVGMRSCGSSRLVLLGENLAVVFRRLGKQETNGWEDPEAQPSGSHVAAGRELVGSLSSVGILSISVFWDREFNKVKLSASGGPSRLLKRDKNCIINLEHEMRNDW